MHPSTPDTPHPTRYPLWLGLASFAWAPAAWALAALAPQLAFVPLVEFLHIALPTITGTLILANLAFSLWALRRRVPVDRLLWVTALQLGLFTALFYQISAHFGAEHYELDRPARSWDWVQFSLAHALKATDVLDTIEAYGLDVQNVTHRGPYLATLLVVYHAVIELFMLGMLWAIVGVWKRHVMNDPDRARLIRRTLWLSFGVWLIAWLVSALWLRPWRPIDIPLWLAENVVRVVDFADAMDSYDIHWHQVPRGPWESTLTFICRVWVGLGIGLFLNWQARFRNARPGVGHHKVPSFSRVARLGVAGVILGLFVGVSHIVVANNQDPYPSLLSAASGADDLRATAALNALRRLGPNAAGMVPPLVEARGRVGPDRRRKITETLGYLGSAAVDAMTDIAASGDATEAMVATEGLERVGPSAAPALVRVGKGSPHEPVRSRAGEALRGFGPKAMKELVAGVTPENSADFYPWFVELDRNWTLRSSPNPTFQAIVTYHQGKLLIALTDRDDQVRKAAVQACALIGSAAEEAVPYLGATLANSDDHQDDQIRQAAAEALGKIGPAAKDAGPDLVKALHERKKPIRQAAVEALGKIGPAAKETIPALLGALADEDSDVRAAAKEALGKIGSAAIPALVEALAGTGISSAAKEVLETIDPNWTASPLGTVGVRHLIASMTRDNPWSVRFNAGQGLQTIGPAAIPVLVAAMADKESDVRTAAREALRVIAPNWSASPLAARSVPALITALANKESSIYSARILGEIGPAAKDAVPALIAALVNQDWYTHSAAEEALPKIDPNWGAAPTALQAVPALITALTEKEEEWFRWAAAVALARIGPGAKDAIPALVASLADSRSLVGSAAKEALRRIGPAAVPALIAGLGSNNWDFLPNAIDTLVAIGPPAVPDLVTALADKDRGVRRAAAEALGKIGPGAKDAVLALGTALADKEWLIRWKAAEALGKIGPGAKDAVTALITALADQAQDVRQATAESLGKIGPAAKDALNKLREVQAKDIDERVKKEATRAIQRIEGNPTKP